MIDTHAHLDFDQFDNDRDSIVSLATAEGVETIINIGTDLASSRRSIELAETYEQVYATVGVHPHDAKTWEKSHAAELEKMAEHPKVLAIGEIGLDYYRNYSPHDQQKRAFTDQIAVARNVGLPIVIHNRDAFGDVFQTLLENNAHEVGGVMHCFAGTVEEAWQTVDYGFIISVGGRLTYKNSQDVPVADKIPLEKIVLETDCPFLTPVPYRGKRNHPALVKYVRAKLAELKKMPEAEIDRITTQAARQAFGLPDAH